MPAVLPSTTISTSAMPARSVAFDVLRRYLKYRGYTVTYVQNFTDVDDKIIKKANEEGTTAAEIAKRYIAKYQDRCPRAERHGR